MASKKKIILFWLIIILSASITGCSQAPPKSLTINKELFIVDDVSVKQITKDFDQEAKLGVLSDAHGYYEHVYKISELFKREKVDAIVMLGDYAQHTRKKPRPELSDTDEIYLCIEAAAKMGIPVYVIPGNHETKQDYNTALYVLSIKYDNIFDLSKIRIVDGDDFDLISNPYGDDQTYSSDGFKGNKKTIEKIKELVSAFRQNKKNNDPEILITHQPPRGKSVQDIDTVFTGQNVGSEILDEVMRAASLRFSFSGHIHEAGGRAADSEGKMVEQDMFVEEMRFNPGSASPWQYLTGQEAKAMAGIVTINRTKMSYKSIEMLS